MKHLVPTLLAAVALSGALARGAAGPDLPNVRADGKRLTFGWHGGSPHRLDVSNLVRAAQLEHVRVLAARQVGDIDYFVVSVSGPSQLGGLEASDPGGTESDLLWLKLKSWKLLDAQSMLYQSYWESLEPIGEYHIKGGILTLRFENKRENTTYVIRYDLTRPEEKMALERGGDVE